MQTNAGFLQALVFCFFTELKIETSIVTKISYRTETYVTESGFINMSAVFVQLLWLPWEGDRQSVLQD